jgi:hypothetical protein
VSDVTVVVVTWNALPWLEQCLESVRQHDVIDVDHGSRTGRRVVRDRFPAVRSGRRTAWAVQQHRHARGPGRYFLLLNSDAWVRGDGLQGDQLPTPPGRQWSGQLLNTDGVAAFGGGPAVRSRPSTSLHPQLTAS